MVIVSQSLATWDLDAFLVLSLLFHCITTAVLSSCSLHWIKLQFTSHSGSRLLCAFSKLGMKFRLAWGYQLLFYACSICRMVMCLHEWTRCLWKRWEVWCAQKEVPVRWHVIIPSALSSHDTWHVLIGLITYTERCLMDVGVDPTRDFLLSAHHKLLVTGESYRYFHSSQLNGCPSGEEYREVLL
jgi:hypothetical protein